MDKNALFFKYRPLLQRIAQGYLRRYGGDWDEVWSDVVYAFFTGLEIYDASRTSLRSFIIGHVWTKLIDLARSRMRHYRCVPFSALELSEEEGTYEVEDTRATDFILEEKFEDADARYVASLVLSPPEELLLQVERKGGQPRNWRSSLRDYLRRRGWSEKRICEAFYTLKMELAVA